MAKTTKRAGRPKGKTPPLSLVTFRADEAVLEALDKLVVALNVPGLAPGGARGVAIRQAILTAAAQLDVVKAGKS